MKARLVKFGEIEVEGERYTHDVVIDGGKCGNGRRDLPRNSAEGLATRRFRSGKKFHGEASGSLSGPVSHGALPVMDEVLAEAKRRGIEVIAAPTSEVCQLLEEVKKGQAYAILHCTC
jgi:hypothetical protein